MTTSSDEPRNETLARLLSGARELRAGVARPAPAPNSVAQADIDGAGEAAALIHQTIALADIWCAIAADQLVGMGALMRDGSSPFAFFPIIRSVVEHSTWACWLLDDEATLQLRAARAALARLRSCDEAVKAVSRMTHSGSVSHVAARQKRDEVRADVARHFGAAFDLSEQTIGGLKVASPTEVIERFGERWGDPRQWVGMYDYLCATANHPTTHALEFFIKTDAGSAAVIAPDLVDRLLRAALVPWVKSLEYMAAYLGWDAAPIDRYYDWLEEVLPVAGE